jgi:hypothetical protein
VTRGWSRLDSRDDSVADVNQSGLYDESRWVRLLRPRTFEALTASLVLLSFATLAAFMPAQNDTWWNLAAGRRIAETHAIELVDHFSWTAAGRYWSNHEWLSQVVFYAAYAAGGMPLLTLCGVVLIVVTLGLVWHSMSGPPLLRALLLLSSGTFLVTEWSLRPKLFTLCAMALTLRLLQGRRFAWLPPVFALWANLHGAVALGVVAMTFACLESLVHERSRLPRLALTSVLCVAATACTPLGLSLFDDVVLSLRRPDYRYISEWQPAGTAGWTVGFFVLATLLAILVFRYRAALDDRERLLTYVALGLFPLACRYSRNIPIFTLAAAPLLSALLLRLRGVTALFRSGPPRPAPYTWPLMVAAAIGVGLASCAWTTRAPVLGWDPIAPAATAAIRACGRPMYNHFDNGGPLIWFVPEQPVFVDSRQHPYPGAFIVEHFAVEDSGAYRLLFNQWGIRCAVLPRYSKVAHAIARDGWRVTYSDASWVVAVAP